MGKFFKWFFGLLAAVIVILGILFLTGNFVVRLATPYGIDITASIGDLQDKDFMRYCKSHDYKFDGFTFKFGDDNDFNADDLK